MTAQFIFNTYLITKSSDVVNLMLSLTGQKKQKLFVVFLKHVFSESETKVHATFSHKCQSRKGRGKERAKNSDSAMLILRNGFVITLTSVSDHTCH